MDSILINVNLVQQDATIQYIKMDVCVCMYVYMSGHNSGTPGAISTKLVTHIAICMFYTYSAGRMVWEIGNLDDSHCSGNQIIAVAK
jgi:hypothetical protein